MYHRKWKIPSIALETECISDYNLSTTFGRYCTGRDLKVTDKIVLSTEASPVLCMISVARRHSKCLLIKPWVFRRTLSIPRK